jgi:hypothetical protein
MVHQVLDILHPARNETVERNNLVVVGQQPVAKMGPEESGATRQ